MLVAYEGAMEDCVNGQEGKQLLTASTEESRRLEVQKSCTMLISDRKVSPLSSFASQSTYTDS